MRKILSTILRFLEWLVFVPAPREDAKARGSCEKRLREGIQRGFPHEQLRLHGCYFFALLRWAEEIRGRGVREKDIVCLFDQARAQMMPDPDNPSGRIPIITDRGFVNDPVRLLNFLAGKRVVTGFVPNGRTNDATAPTPTERIFVAREKHPRHGAHFVLVINGKRWDSLPLPGRVPAGFRVLA